MNTARLIGKNLSSLVFAQVITMISGFFLVVCLARYLGTIGYGKLSFAQSFTSILVVFADCGINVMSIREISKNKNNVEKYLSNTLAVKVFLAFLAFIIIYLTINLMDYPADTTLIVILFGVSTIINTFSQYLRSIFKAFEKMEYEALLNIFYSLILLTSVVLLLNYGFGLLEIAYAYIITEVINFTLTFLIIIKKFAKPNFELDLSFCKLLIKEAIPFSMTIFVGMIYLKIDTVMLSSMKGYEAVGWYNASCTIIFALLFIPNIYILSIFPLMSRFYKNNSNNDLKIIIEKSSKYMFMLSLAITLLLLTLSEKIIYLIYGNSFANSITILKILSIYLPLRFVNNITGYTLASINKESFHAGVGLIGAFVNIILNIYLIPHYSFIGAAIATVLTEIIMFITFDAFVTRFFTRIPIKKLYFKAAISFLCSLIYIYFFNFGVLTNLLTSVSIYMIVLYKLNAFDQDDFRILSNLIGRVEKRDTI
jgi:O-antigen/teichoic acid export membrane protein